MALLLTRNWILFFFSVTKGFSLVYLFGELTFCFIGSFYLISAIILIISAQCWQRSGEGVRAPGAGVIRGRELSEVGAV